MDSARALDLLFGPPLSLDKAVAANEQKLASAAHAAFVASASVEQLLRVAGTNGPPECAGAAAGAMQHVWRTLGGKMRATFEAGGGPTAMVRVLRNPYVELPYRAAAACNLWNYLVPDRRGLGEGTEATLRRMHNRVLATEAAAGVGAGTSQSLADGEQVCSLVHSPHLADFSLHGQWPPNRLCRMPCDTWRRPMYAAQAENSGGGCCVACRRMGTC